MSEQAEIKAYNITVTPQDSIDTTPNANGTAKMRFRATFMSKGEQKTRTVLAQGKAAEAIANVVKIGEPVALRVQFNHAPGENGQRGGEYLNVLGIPAKKAA